MLNMDNMFFNQSKRSEMFNSDLTRFNDNKYDMKNI